MQKRIPNPYYPLRNRDALLAEYETQEAKKTAAKATMIEKAKKYRKVINFSFIITCLTAVASMALAIVHRATNAPFLSPITVIVGAAMGVSLLTFLVSLVAKKIWGHNLLKLGLMLPPELE